MRYLPLILALALAGCASTASQAPVGASNRGACVSLKPHLPMKVSRHDTDGTKRKAYRANSAFVGACGRR